LPAHPPLVGAQPLDRRPREADQRHVAMVQVDERAVEPVAQAGATGAGAERVVGAEHDVVGEQLCTPVEELGEGLLAVLGVELVLLLDRDPGEIATLSLDLLVSLRLLGLELGELVPGRLPFLAGSDLVFRHLQLLSVGLELSRTSRSHRRIGRYRDHEVRLAGTRKLIASVLEPQPHCSTRSARRRLMGAAAALSDGPGTVLDQALAAAGCMSAAGSRRRPGMSRTDSAATMAPSALMRKAISKPAFWGSPLARTCAAMMLPPIWAPTAE